MPFKHLTIKSKLLMFLAVPLVGMLFFASQEASRQLKQYQVSQETQNTLRLTATLIDLAHAAQKERGLTAGMIAGMNGERLQQLTTQRQQTDDIVLKFFALLDQQTYPHLTQQNLDALRQHAMERVAYRGRMDQDLKAKQTQIDFAFDHYSQGIGLVINNIHALQNHYQDKTLLQYGDILSTILLLSEKSGQERGRINQVFTSRVLTVTHLQEISANIQLQQDLLNQLQQGKNHLFEQALANLMNQQGLAQFYALRHSALQKFHRIDLLNSLYTEIGYGGLIHDFKNYVIRGNPMYAERFQRRYARLNNLINNYLKQEGVSAHEVTQLRHIQATFDEYQNHLNTIESMHLKGQSIESIDAIVKVDDIPALQALNLLKNEVTQLNTEQWWDSATQRINRMIHMENQVLSAMVQHARLLKQQALKQLIMHGLFLGTLLILLGWLSYHLYRRLVVDVTQMSVDIEQAVKNETGPLQLNESGHDELSRLAHAFNFLMDERHLYERKIWMQANHDHLTGLPNRKLLTELINQVLTQAEREQQQFSVVFIDLDHFKAVNDTYGHAAGDQILVEAAERLEDTLRHSDIAAHLSGDEFVAILTHQKSYEDTEQVAIKLIQAMQEPFEINQHSIHLSCSIGISLYPDDGNDYQTLVKHADTAMYQAKLSGKNTFRFFKPAMNRAIQNRLEIERELKIALQEQQFEVYYQPVINDHTQQVEEVEALLRWHHPEKGLVEPETFIEIAEKSGLIIKIGQWVLEHSMQTVAQWHQQHNANVSLAVNVSSRQFNLQHATLKDSIQNTAQSTGFDLNKLNLEITEHSLMAHSKQTSECLAQLKQLGIGLHLDDFGTGYSSLSYLKRFPMSALKIDAMFVKDIESDTESQQLVQAILHMAESLKIEVITEGVETPAQHAFMQQQGAKYLQGHLFAEALPAEACLEFIKTYPNKTS